MQGNEKAYGKVRAQSLVTAWRLGSLLRAKATYWDTQRRTKSELVSMNRRYIRCRYGEASR
jgi:hypothetical protein